MRQCQRALGGALYLFDDEMKRNLNLALTVIIVSRFNLADMYLSLDNPIFANNQFLLLLKFLVESLNHNLQSAYIRWAAIRAFNKINEEWLAYIGHCHKDSVKACIERYNAEKNA